MTSTTSNGGIDVGGPIGGVIGGVGPETRDEFHGGGERGWHVGVPVPSPVDLGTAAVKVLDEGDVVEWDTSLRPGGESSSGKEGQQENGEMHDGVHDVYTETD